jgi:hypothetical protein
VEKSRLLHHRPQNKSSPTTTGNLPNRSSKMKNVV